VQFSGFSFSHLFRGCSDDSSPVSLCVRIAKAVGKEIRGATIVLGNTDGGVVAYSTTDITGATGFQNPVVTFSLTPKPVSAKFHHQKNQFLFLSPVAFHFSPQFEDTRIDPEEMKEISEDSALRLKNVTASEMAFSTRHSLE